MPPLVHTRPACEMSPAPRVGSMQFIAPGASPCSGSWPVATYTRLLLITGVEMTSLGPSGDPYFSGFPAFICRSGGLQSKRQSSVSVGTSGGGDGWCYGLDAGFVKSREQPSRPRLAVPGAPPNTTVGFPPITPYAGLDQLHICVRRLIPDRSTPNSLPVFLSRQIRAGQSGAGRCLLVQSTPLDVLTKSFSPTTSTELLV